jgi:hypothetical protein
MIKMRISPAKLTSSPGFVGFPFRIFPSPGGKKVLKDVDQ